jgi:glycosyltransferase involved in cell wall biosynthesis
MKILIDMQSIQAGSAKGGIGRYSFNLLKYILKNNNLHDISVLLNAKLSLDVYDELLNLIPKQKIYLCELFSDTQENKQENHFRSEVSKLTKEYVVSLINPDIFFITSLVEGFFDNVVESVGDIFPAQRTVVILYDLIPLAQPDFYLNNPVVKKHYMQKISHLSKSGLLLSISSYSRYEAIEMLNLPHEKVINISSGVDEKFKNFEVLPSTKDTLLKKYNLKSKFIMYTSSFDVRKNQANLLAAFASLDSTILDNYQLLLIGNGAKSDLDKLRESAKKFSLAQDRVVLLGYICDEDLLNLYNLASLFVFPSFFEGFGLPALEAMSCGVPTIGSKTTSIVEVIDDEDAFFNPKDINSIATKIKQVLSDEEFANKLKKNGLSQAKNFSWDITSKKALRAIEQYYESLDTLYPQEVTSYYKKLINKISQVQDIQEVSDTQLANLSDIICKNTKNFGKKIAIISTYNTRCGIASYTKYLSQSFISDSVILAPYASKKTLTARDESNVLRIWNLSNDDLNKMLEYILDTKLSVVFIQFNYGFFNFKHINRFINILVDSNIKVYITFHSTTDDKTRENKELKLINSLSRCSTLFVHSKKDINNLKSLNLNKNVMLLNQGIIDTTSSKPITKSKQKFTMATYGFFLPNKGLLSMLEACSILKEQGCDFKLLMLNAKYTDEASDYLINQAMEYIKNNALEDIVSLNTDYLSDEDTISILSKTDLVVYPYKNTGESSSAAVRMAIAAQTNIAVTPQPIFDEVKEFSFVFDTQSAEDIAKGIDFASKQILQNTDILKKMVQKRELFREQNLYSKLSYKLKEIIL